MRFLALLAWLFFAFSFFTAIRSAWLARLVGGLSRQHRLHHWLGLFAVALLVLHTLREIYVDSEVAFYFEDPFLLLGWLSLLLLLLALGASFANKVHHRWWIAIHWSFLLAFVLGFLHGLIFLHPGRIHAALFYSIAALGSASILGILYYRSRGRRWIVREVQQVGGGLFEVVLRTERQGSTGLKAGSLVYVQLGHSFTQNWHPFSVASCRTSPELHLIVKNAGVDTSHLSDLEPGHSVLLQGPFAEFEITERPQVWVAAGVGIAPFLGMARCFDYRKAGPVTLVYYTERIEEPIKMELDRLASEHPEFRWFHSEGKSADLAILDQTVSADRKAQFLVCGSSAFMRKIRKHLIDLGLPTSDIETEEFTPW